MADEDEIDILGDFTFISCLAQNNLGIPSCSSSEDTVHPQWLLDTPANNWYDEQNKNNLRAKQGASRVLAGTNKATHKHEHETQTIWTVQERKLLDVEMKKYGRNIRKLSQSIKTKTPEEIHALIEAEYGVNLETPSFGLEKTEDQGDVPPVVQEEIVADDDAVYVNNVINMVTTGAPTVPSAQKKNRNRLIKPLSTKTDLLTISSSEIFYDDDLAIGCVESVSAQEVDTMDIVTKKLLKNNKDDKLKFKVTRKIGNHRRKNSRNFDKTSPKPRNASKDKFKSPGRQRKYSSLSEDSTKSPKMQIVLGSGLALPVSEGEQVIKIEKKKDSEPESDIEIDVDSDNSDNTKDSKISSANKLSRINNNIDKTPIAVPLTKYEPIPRRQKKINLDGGGGYTIMHTASGDLYAVGAEPKKDRQPKKPQVNLIQCKVYNSERPPPVSVFVAVSALIAMDVQAHTSRGEVMGLVGGAAVGDRLDVQKYRPAAAAASRTHCDMDPVSQALAAEYLRESGYSVVGWHHSHPSFPASPSEQDVRTQTSLQRALERPFAPFLAFITSQHWPIGRSASQYKCIHVESDDGVSEVPYQLSVKLVQDLTAESVQTFLQELRDIILEEKDNEFTVNVNVDVCKQAGVTYLDKCVSSVSHHLRSAGYTNDDPVVIQMSNGLRDVFR